MLPIDPEKSRLLATALFPHEEWIFKEPHIWVAKSRLAEEEREPDKWEREMTQVRILTSRGSTAYFLPERPMPGQNAKTCADLVLDGVILEMKTSEGTRATIGAEFRLAYKQGAALIHEDAQNREHSVFIRLKSDISVGSIKAKIAGELKQRTDLGAFICFFEKTGELQTWTYDDLRAIIGT